MNTNTTCSQTTATCWKNSSGAVLRPDKILSLVRSLTEPPRHYYKRTQMTHDEYLRAFGGGLGDSERDSRAQGAHHVSEMVSDEGTSELALRVLSAIGVHLGRCGGVKRELQRLAHAAVTLLRSSRDDSPLRQSYDDPRALYAPCVDDWRELRAKPR